MRFNISSVTITLALILAGVAPAPAHGPFPEVVPIARMLQNLPQNDHYARGRVHYYAYIQGIDLAVSTRDQIDSRYLSPQYGQSGTPERIPPRPDSPSPVVNSATISTKEMAKAHPLSKEERLNHLKDAILDLSIAAKPTSDIRAKLCLACVLEAGANDAHKIGNTAAAWRKEAERLYLEVYNKTWQIDERGVLHPIRRSSIRYSGGFLGYYNCASYEASESYSRLLLARKTPNQAEKRLLEKMAKQREKLKARPYGITPLVFSLTESQPLEALLDPASRVKFDLRGFGQAETFPWVKPTTTFLVWDPERSGKITSGRQLFGNATWWMFFSDAYAAMRALDDNHDGWLTGKELAGLAIWTDRNQNGTSDAGEVTPVEQSQIIGIATRSVGKSGISPMNAAGLVLRDGRVLPTYDWTFSSPQDFGTRTNPK